MTSLSRSEQSPHDTATEPAVRPGERLLDTFIRDTEIMMEAERLLAGRTRYIRLTGKTAAAYRQRSWRQTAKVIRSWMLWVILLDLFMLFLSVFLLPGNIAVAMLAPGALIIPAALIVLLVWRKPRPRHQADWTLVAGMLVILLSVSWMGMASGMLERYLHIMLFVAITGIIIFNISFIQSLAIAIVAMAIYLIIQLGYVEADMGITLSGFFFFASGVGATVLARRTMNVLSQKSFLLELRDRHRMNELARTNTRLERLSKIDGLTGAANRHYMRERMGALSRHDGEVGLLMCDIDEFKALNDHLGHLEGDRCLVEVARIIMECTRAEADCVARYGGEEFLVLLADASKETALTVAERVRHGVAAAALPNPRSGVAPTLTLSIGVTTGSIRKGSTLEQLQLRADAALYSAKREGRNRVRWWTEGMDATGGTA